jgi:mono/diheme cytochrome c family protein
VRRLALLAAIGFAVALTSCDRFANQPKLRGFTVPFGSDLAYPLVPPTGTVATDDKLTHEPPPVTLALLQHGRERFNIYCAPCHGRSGDGVGMIAVRGLGQRRTPANYHTARLRAMPDGHFYDVISNGFGVMYSYASRINEPADRWAIVAYIRALQRAQNARPGDVPGGDPRAAEAARTTPAAGAHEGAGEH